MLWVFGVNVFAVFVDQLLLCIEGGVDAEHPVVEKKWAVFVFLHPLHRFFGHAIFDVLFRHSRVVIEVFKFPRCDKTAGWAWAWPVWDVDIKSMLKW